VVPLLLVLGLCAETTAVKHLQPLLRETMILVCELGEARFHFNRLCYYSVLNRLHYSVNIQHALHTSHASI
jgi:hypothetical protein